ncbi:MAG: TIGR03620 family F420-dependent LLM class oxidoreductase [Acidimicrobiales bacterium]|jgi:probable F420-dependent oxidoreductase
MSTWPSSLEQLRGTIGVWTFAHETVPANQSGEIATELESLGYAAMWLPEAWSREAFTSAGLMLAATSSMIVATGIANIWARDAVAAANAAKTLNAAYADRFVLGLGVSHRPLVERLRGHEYVSPVEAMRDYLTAMDAAPMMAPEGEHRYARVIAALGPKMLEVGATLADGVHPYLVTPEHTARARAAVGDKFVGVEQAVVLGQSREEFLTRAHAYLGFYTGLDNYKNSWRRLGFTEEDFVRGGSERLCDAMVVHGDEGAVLERVNEHRRAGADHVCLQVLSDETNAPPFDEWRRLGSILAP